MHGELDRAAILAWLRERDPARLAELWREADEVRRRRVGDAVHLRGLLEISNHCARECGYCGIRASHRDLPRYRMSAAEVLEAVEDIVALGYGTVVLQAGEDPGLKREAIAEIVARIKSETPLAVTLSLGERCDEDLSAWRRAGADRYLLRFETSDPALYARIHPPRRGADPQSASPAERVGMLRRLREMGYEIGSGIMVGLPGQTYDSVADDLDLFRSLDLDMIGLGPYLPHPETPLAQCPTLPPARPDEQVPNDEETTCICLALARLLCPDANIPSTTALSALGAQSRAHGLTRGANVVMPNMTPLQYRRLYEIYPAKAQVDESADDFRTRLPQQLADLGRCPAHGQGSRRRG